MILIPNVELLSHYITLRYVTLHYVTLRYVTLRYVTLHYITVHYSTLHYITFHYITLHYITLHYITLRYITLHYITLQYITLHHTIYLLLSISKTRIQFNTEILHYKSNNPALTFSLKSSFCLVLRVGFTCCACFSLFRSKT